MDKGLCSRVAPIFGRSVIDNNAVVAPRVWMLHVRLAMVGNALFFIVMSTVAAFMANRLYVIVRYQAITVKGVTYSRKTTPKMYWVQMLLIVVALVLIGGIAVLITLGDFGLLD